MPCPVLTSLASFASAMPCPVLTSLASYASAMPCPVLTSLASYASAMPCPERAGYGALNAALVAVPVVRRAAARRCPRSAAPGPDLAECRAARVCCWRW
eukprot:2456609-Rhodomonas_salina.1